MLRLTVAVDQFDASKEYCNRGVSKEIDMQKLSDVMSRDVIVISPEASIHQAAQKMRIGDCGLLPVGENDRLIGAISDRDIVIRAVADN